MTNKVDFPRNGLYSPLRHSFSYYEHNKLSHGHPLSILAESDTELVLRRNAMNTINPKAKFELDFDKFIAETMTDLGVEFPKLKLRVKREGAVQAIKTLLLDRDENSFGYLILKDKGRLDRSIEQFVLDHVESGFFTGLEIEIARKRLGI